MSFPWNDESIAHLKRLHAQGLSTSDIAVIFAGTYRRPVSRNTVIGKITRLKLNGVQLKEYTNWTAEAVEELKQLNALKQPASEIADRLMRKFGGSFSKSTVLKKLKRLGIANAFQRTGWITTKGRKPGRLTGIIATTGHGGHKSRADYITSSRGLDGENHSTAGRAGPALTGVWEPPEAAHGDGCRAGPRETSSPAKGKRLLDLKSDECHWAINERHGFDEHLFCGAEIEPDSPHEKYCKAHARRAGSGYGRMG